MSKSFIFLVNTLLGNFYRHLAIYIWSHWAWLSLGFFKFLFYQWCCCINWQWAVNEKNQIKSIQIFRIAFDTRKGTTHWSTADRGGRASNSIYKKKKQGIIANWYIEKSVRTRYLSILHRMKVDIFEFDKIGCQIQSDQIGRFIGLWSTFHSLWQQLISPNLLHS